MPSADGDARDRGLRIVAASANARAVRSGVSGVCRLCGTSIARVVEGRGKYFRARLTRGNRRRRTPANRGNVPPRCYHARWSPCPVVRRRRDACRQCECAGARGVERGRSPAVHRPDDGLDGPALPVLPAPRHAPCAAVHRDDHGARAAARRRAASPRLRSAPSIRSRCSSAAATPRELAHAARLGAALGLRRDQPQLRLPVRARADRQLRRVPDGRARAGRALRARRCATR